MCVKRILIGSSDTKAECAAAQARSKSDSPTLRNRGGSMLFAEGSLYINSYQPNKKAIGFNNFDVDSFFFFVCFVVLKV